ncbi:hypothetical protein Bca101_083405 [Brassica carinata]
MVMAVEDLHVCQIPHRANSDIGFDADIKSLGFAVSYALAKARGVAGQCNSVAVLTNHPEGESFINYLVKVSITVDRARLEPFFWTTGKKSRLFMVAHAILCLGQHSQSVQIALDDSAERLLGPSKNWFTCLPFCVRRYLAHFCRNQYKYSTFIDLVRFVRNKIVHCDENQGYIRTWMGHTEESVVEAFTEIYPGLLDALYQILSRHFSTNLSFKTKLSGRLVLRMLGSR